jgi:hypothetical protein
MYKLDFYEFVGILAPGVVFLVGLGYLFPDLESQMIANNISIGDFGILLIISYVSGHVVQSVGNLIEKVYWWFWGGEPTDWVRTKKHYLISVGQIIALKQKISQQLINEHVEDIDKLNYESWRSLTRQISARIVSMGMGFRINLFNGNYGLFRGISSVFISLLAIMLLNIHIFNIKLIFGLIFLIVLSLYRMHRFGCNYAKELFTQFIELPSKNSVAEGEVNAK